MSVIVKGMKMPKNCLHCDFDDSYGICACKNEAPYVCEYSAKQRPSWCPLEEVPSAQPETHDKRTETHGVCLDTISRQATLDWLKNEWNGMITSLFDGIKALPSAQSETHDKRTKTHSCDCISRQAAIEINRSYHGQMPNEVNHRIWKEINELPSAQPEIVLCKDCVKRNRKFGSLDEHYNRYNKSQCCPMIEFRGMPQGHEFDYQYCSWAERRTDDLQ